MEEIHAVSFRSTPVTNDMVRMYMWDFETEEWTDLVDRGGLTHVDDMLFDMFVAMEMEIRRHIGTASETSSMRDRAIDGILNDDVKFYWSMVASGDWVETESMLLRMIVNHWVTIRAHWCLYGTL